MQEKYSAKDKIYILLFGAQREAEYQAIKYFSFSALLKPFYFFSFE